MAISNNFHSNYFEDEIVHSPTDSSEDSVEVKITPISSRLVHKRKCAEPRKVHEPSLSGPLKKRVCLQVKRETHPFRPWSPQNHPQDNDNTAEAYFRPPTPPLLIKTEIVKEEDQPVDLIKKNEDVIRVPIHPRIDSPAESEILRESREVFPILRPTLDLSQSPTPSSSSRHNSNHQRNYKNMTRERRIEANARERTRVHTISAAFDTLRRSIPSYSHNQKLSKLSVLRIACSYIMTLSSIVSDEDDGEPTTEECVDLITKTIQREGKLRKKKDDND